MRTTIAAIMLCGAALIGPQTAVAQDADTADTGDDSADAVAIANLFYGGSGCKPRDSVKATLINSDHNGRAERLRLQFSDFSAEQGPHASPGSSRPFCNVQLSVDQPKGWQFAIQSARFAGKADLPAGVLAKVGSTYNFPFSPPAPALQSIINGPYDAAYSRGDALDKPQLVWSKCALDAPRLGIITNIFLGGAKSKPASVSSTRQTYWLHWRQCK